MMYMCLMASLSSEAKAKVIVWKDQYTIDGRVSGNALLKVIIRESHLDTNATSNLIRTKLSSLDKYITTIGCDVTKFNTHVKLLVESLAARGEQTNDLLINLFKGYGAAHDKTFVSYIAHRKMLHDDGEDVTPDALMELANNKFKNLVQEGTWNAPSESEEKIMALESKIKKLEKLNKTRTPKDKKSVATQKEAKKAPKAVKPAWLKKHIPPKGGDPKTKTWNGASWHWCSPETGGKCKGAWRIHSPKDCKGIERKDSDTKRKNETNSSENKGKKLRLNKALQAVVNDAEAEAGDESDFS